MVCQWSYYYKHQSVWQLFRTVNVIDTERSQMSYWCRRWMEMRDQKIKWKLSFRLYPVIFPLSLFLSLSVSFLHHSLAPLLSLLGWEGAAPSVPQHGGRLGAAGQGRHPAKAPQPWQPHPHFPACQSHLWLPPDRGITYTAHTAAAGHTFATLFIGPTGTSLELLVNHDYCKWLELLIYN